MKQFLALDKLYHAIAGALIAGLTVWVGISPSWAMLAVIAAALVKDIVWDRWLGRGVFERPDIIATMLGGGVTLVVIDLLS